MTALPVCVLECVQSGEAGGRSVLPVLQRTHGDDNEETKVLCHEVRVFLNHALSCCYWNTGHPALAFVSLCVLNTWTFPFFPKALIFIYTSMEPFSTFKGSQHHVWQTTLEPLYALVPSDSFFFIPRRCNVALEGSSRIGLAGGWHAWEYVMVAMELQWLIFSGPVKREMRQR